MRRKLSCGTSSSAPPGRDQTLARLPVIRGLKPPVRTNFPGPIPAQSPRARHTVRPPPYRATPGQARAPPDDDPDSPGPRRPRGQQILDNRDYRGLSGAGSGHGRHSSPRARAGDRRSRRRPGDPAGTRLARRQAVREHPHRLRPGHRDHPAAARQPRAVMAGLVPGAGGAPGHRRHRAARGPVRPPAGRRRIVPGHRGPQARRRVGLVRLAGPARAHHRQPGRRDRPPPGRPGPPARARPDPGPGPRAPPRGRHRTRPAARPHRSAGGRPAAHRRPGLRGHRRRRRRPRHRTRTPGTPGHPGAPRVWWRLDSPQMLSSG